MQHKQKSVETKEHQTLLRQVAVISETDAGIALFQWLVDECGAHLPSICIDAKGRIDVRRTVYNEARRDIWLRLRQLIPHSQLILIELPLPKAQTSDEHLEDL